MHPGLWELFCLKANVSQNSHAGGDISALGLAMFTEQRLRDGGVTEILKLRAMSDADIMAAGLVGRSGLKHIRDRLAAWDSLPL